MATEVPARRTPWTTPELLAALADGWRAFGIEPSRFTLAVGWGQGAIETGRGGTGCFNGNIGNVMGEDPETGCYHVLGKAPECAVNPYAIPGATVLTSPHVACAPGTSPYLPAGGSRFRAYADLRAGCRDKLRVLARLWPKAFRVLASAQGPEAAEPYARALLQGVGTPLTPELVVALVLADTPIDRIPTGGRKYMTADPVKYGGDMLSLSRECISRTPDASWPPPAAMQPITVEILADLSLDAPATPLRAGEGEHTVKLEEPEL